MYKKYFKNIFDRLVSFFGFVMLSPIFILVLILLIFVNKGNPFYFQIRPGKNERLFRIIKFKTMSDKIDSKGFILPDNLRLTAFGKIIRKTSLDEIPQLLNVIKGDMSIIGPRPLLPEYLPLYNQEQRRRHDVLPGITGWAQVNGRNALSWKSKFELDVWYVDNMSFLLDLKIMWMTVIKIFKTEHINSPTAVTMHKFTWEDNQ